MLKSELVIGFIACCGAVIVITALVCTVNLEMKRINAVQPIPAKIDLNKLK